MRQISKIEIRIRRLVWRLPKRTLLILICILIGIVAGISAFLLKSLLQNVHNFIKLLTNRNLSNIFLVCLHIISSSLTIGFGGSAGFEAPIVATGSAIGSNIACYFKIAENERALLLASGAAAGISAIYNAPIAGVLFAIEVLLVDMSVTAFIPLLLASATAAIVSRILFQGQLFVLITDHWSLNAIPIYVLMGGLAGLYSVLIIRQTIKIERLFVRISNKWIRVGIGGVLLSALIFIFPSLFGEGYFSIQSILNHQSIAVLNPGFFSINNNFILIDC